MYDTFRKTFFRLRKSWYRIGESIFAIQHASKGDRVRKFIEQKAENKQLYPLSWKLLPFQLSENVLGNVIHNSWTWWWQYESQGHQEAKSHRNVSRRVAPSDQIQQKVVQRVETKHSDEISLVFRSPPNITPPVTTSLHQLDASAHISRVEM